MAEYATNPSCNQPPLCDPAEKRRWILAAEHARSQRRVAEARRERQAMRSLIRDRIGRKDLTAAQKRILEFLVNLWFVHRYGEGVIRPGRERIAKRCGYTPKTVQTALARFRSMAILKPVADEKGGARATRYTVDLAAIHRRWGVQAPVPANGVLVPFNPLKNRILNTVNIGLEGGKNFPRIEDISPSVERADSGADPIQQSDNIILFPRSRIVGDLLSSTVSSPVRKTLRPHQEEAIRLLRSSLGKGNRRVVVQGPTGFGKTVVAAKIIEGALAKGNRAIFTAPAVNLIDQTVSAFRAEGIAHIGVMQADHPGKDLTAPVQVASIQTLARREMPTASLVIVDECHIRAEVIDQLMVDRPDLFFVGLSATPWRKGMGLLWQDLVIPCDIAGLINSGFLSKFTAYAPDVPDLRGVKTVAGDFAESALAEIMGDRKYVGSVVETWLAKGDNRPTLCFAVNRAHAQQLAVEFMAHGIATGYVDADTDRIERGRLNRQFRDGDVRVICSVRTMTTGVDLPVSCIIDAAPTKSEMLHVQKIGRGLRVNPGTEDCLILDHAGNSLRLGLVTDIRHETLDVTKPGDKPERKPKADRLPNPCPKCATLFSGSKCPSCGHEKRPPRIEAAEGELVELTAKKAPPTQAEKERFWQMAVWLDASRQRGGKLAKGLYYGKFGVWPKGLSNDPLPPDAAFMNYEKSRRIAFAKSKARRAA